MFWANFAIFVPQNESHEKENHHHLCLVGACPLAGFVRLKPFDEGHAQGRATDGKAGKTEQKTVQEGQESPLQASGPENQAHDTERQATFRTDATQTKVEPVFLLMRAYILIRCKAKLVHMK